MSTGGRSRLFLLELVLCLTIFVLCAAVCAALLVRAWSLSRESARLTQGVYLAQSAAEALRAGADLPQMPQDYDLDVRAEPPEDGVCAATITVSCQGEIVYTLDTAWPEEVAP